jgi:hypothetical protein
MPVGAKRQIGYSARRKRPDSGQYDEGGGSNDGLQSAQHALEPSAPGFRASKELCEFGSKGC